MEVIKKLFFTILIFGSTLASDNQISEYLMLVNIGLEEKRRASELRNNILETLQIRSYENSDTDYKLEAAIESLNGYDYDSIFQNLFKLLSKRAKDNFDIYCQVNSPFREPQPRRRRFKLEKDLRPKILRKLIEKKASESSPQIEAQSSPTLEAAESPRIEALDKASNSSNLLEE